MAKKPGPAEIERTTLRATQLAAELAIRQLDDLAEELGARQRGADAPPVPQVTANSGAHAAPAPPSRPLDWIGKEIWPAELPARAVVHVRGLAAFPVIEDLPGFAWSIPPGMSVAEFYGLRDRIRSGWSVATARDRIGG